MSSCIQRWIIWRNKLSTATIKKNGERKWNKMKISKNKTKFFCPCLSRRVAVAVESAMQNSFYYRKFPKRRKQTSTPWNKHSRGRSQAHSQPSRPSNINFKNVCGEANIKMLQIKFHSLMIQTEAENIAAQKWYVFTTCDVLQRRRRRRKMWKNMPRRSSSMKTFESNKYLIELCACVFLLLLPCFGVICSRLVLSRGNDFMIK